MISLTLGPTQQRNENKTEQLADLAIESDDNNALATTMYKLTATTEDRALGDTTAWARRNTLAERYSGALDR